VTHPAPLNVGDIAPLVHKLGRPPRVGLALGTGAARGWAHLGVLQALEEAKIPIHAIAGCSMGALVGGMYCASGLGPLQHWAGKTRMRQLLTFIDPVFPRSGLIDGEKVLDFIHDLVADPPIESFPIRFAAVSTDLARSQAVFHLEGPLLEAIRASISLPGIFTPARDNGRLLVDGGLVDPLPTTILKEMGAEWIIAVDLTLNASIRLGKKRSHVPHKEPRLDPLPYVKGPLRRAWRRRVDGIRQWWEAEGAQPNMVEILLSSLYTMQSRLVEESLQETPADVLLRPPLDDIRLLEFHRAWEAISVGHRVMQEAIAAWGGAQWFTPTPPTQPRGAANP